MSPYEIVRAALETAAVCSYLRDSSNETWSSFAVPVGFKGWSLQIIAKSVGVSAVNVARALR